MLTTCYSTTVITWGMHTDEKQAAHPIELLISMFSLIIAPQSVIIVTSQASQFLFSFTVINYQGNNEIGIRLID